jgi:hypothetical protein
MDLNISIWSRAASSSFLKRSFSNLSCWIYLAFTSMLMFTWFFMLPALTAYCRVERVYSR